LRKELPANAAEPATIAPINPVIIINKKEDPPNGNSCATLCDKMLSFCISIQSDSTNHNTNIPAKPAKKLRRLDCGISNATIKAIMAILHHGNSNPDIKDNTAISKAANKNFIN